MSNWICPPYTEKDVNADTLWVWCYPSIGADLREVLLRKCCLTLDNRVLHTFVFGQYCRTWYYITTVEVQEPTALKKVLDVMIRTSQPSWKLSNLCSNNVKLTICSFTHLLCNSKPEWMTFFLHIHRHAHTQTPIYINLIIHTRTHIM